MVLRAHEQIKARAAAHGAEVYDILRRVRVAQERREHMLHGVHRDVIHIVAAVRLAGAQIVCRDIAVDARDVHPRDYIVVIDRKAGYSLHKIPSCFLTDELYHTPGAVSMNIGARRSKNRIEGDF